MLRFAFVIASLLVCLSPASSANAQSWIGSWSTSDSKYSYTFKASGDFECKGESYNYSLKAKGRTNASGVWQSGLGICWEGEKNSGRDGDLLIQVDDLQCCLSAQIISDKLALSKIWAKGTDSCGACSNRVLTFDPERPAAISSPKPSTVPRSSDEEARAAYEEYLRNFYSSRTPK